MGTRIVKDVATGQFFRLAHNNHEVQPMTFSEAAADLDRLVKSRRREQSLRAMADAKDYDESDIDSFDRRAQGPRRKDMRTENRAWAGIQALDDDELFALGDELAEESRMMLVSGRPSRIRFPGARSDSELRPFDREAYVADDDVDGDFPEGRDRISERNSNIRGALGGDSLSWRSQASRCGTGEDAYTERKSFAGRSLSPLALLKSFNSVKSRLHAAMMDEQIDPNILLNYDAAFTETRLGGINLDAAMRALAMVSPRVREAYNIPSVSGNRYEEMGQIRRGA
jgi:hypothetical protein